MNDRTHTAPTKAEWQLFAALFGDEAAAHARSSYAHRRRAFRVRLFLSTLAFLVSACMALGAIYGFLLLMIAAYDAVVGN